MRNAWLGCTQRAVSLFTRPLLLSQDTDFGVVNPSTTLGYLRSESELWADTSAEEECSTESV